MEQNQYYYLKVDRKRNDEIVKFVLLLLQHQNEVAGYYFALRVTKKKYVRATTREKYNSN